MTALEPNAVPSKKLIQALKNRIKEVKKEKFSNVEKLRKKRAINTQLDNTMETGEDSIKYETVSKNEMDEPTYRRGVYHGKCFKRKNDGTIEIVDRSKYPKLDNKSPPNIDGELEATSTSQNTTSNPDDKVEATITPQNIATTTEESTTDEYVDGNAEEENVEEENVEEENVEEENAEEEAKSLFERILENEVHEARKDAVNYTIDKMKEIADKKAEPKPPNQTSTTNKKTKAKPSSKSSSGLTKKTKTSPTISSKSKKSPTITKSKTSPTISKSKKTKSVAAKKNLPTYSYTSKRKFGGRKKGIFF
jgi:hypothetical protein